MGLFDEVVLDERMKSLLGLYAGDGVFQTKYQATEDGYIRVYNFAGIGRRICCSISVGVDLLVKPRDEYVCEEPLMRTLKLEELGVAEKLRATVSTRVYIDDYNGLVEILANNGFQRGETREGTDFTTFRRRIATIPLRETLVLKLRRVKASDILGREEEPGEDKEEDLLELLKKHRTLIYIDNGEFGIALPPGALIEVHAHSLEVSMEERRERAYKEEEWVKEEPGESGLLTMKVVIEHRFPTEARIEAIVTSKLDERVKERVDKAVEKVSNLLSKILE